MLIDNTLEKFSDNSPRAHYSFDSFFSDSESNLARYERTRNLFYVACSRAKINLAFIALSPLQLGSKSKIKELFGEIIEI